MCMWKAERSTSTRAAALLPSAVAGPRLLSAHVRFTIHHPGAPPLCLTVLQVHVYLDWHFLEPEYSGRLYFRCMPVWGVAHVRLPL